MPKNKVTETPPLGPIKLTPTHTPGPTRVFGAVMVIAPDVGEAICNILDGRDTRAKPVWIDSKRWEECTLNARLISASYNSYDKHFGRNAVEAAEGDYLGLALELLGEICGAHTLGPAIRARAFEILSKTTGPETPAQVLKTK